MVDSNDAVAIRNDTALEQIPKAKSGKKDAEEIEYSVVDFYTEGSLFTTIAVNKYFEYVTLAVISCNAVWIGIDINNNEAPSLANAELIFVVAENFFCFYFTYEILTRFLAFKRKRNCLRDSWFVFDFFLCSSMAIETWVFPIMISSNAGNLGSLSILRLLRLLRLTRMARLMRQVPELLTLVKGMGAASRSVFSTLALLVIILYVFGVMFAGQYHNELSNDGCDECVEMWGSVPTSMFTLFVAGTLLDDITYTCNMIRMGPLPGMLVVFYVYVLLSSFTVLNMLIGVVCEVISTTAKAENEQAMVAQVNQLLTDVFNDVDLDGSGLISKKEFDMMTEQEDVILALTLLDVQPKHLMALSDTLFEPDEEDAEDKELNFQEFLEMIILLRPQNNASVLDVAQLRKCQRRLTVAVESKLLALEDALDPNGEKRKAFSLRRKQLLCRHATKRMDKQNSRKRAASHSSIGSSSDMDKDDPTQQRNSKINELRLLLERQRERCNRAEAEIESIQGKVQEMT
eukprot:GEMP01035876.1.p1 GENE.GEMP01035876.1~~GEMP01035876.1.p1  ORF type:complete len:516 (+),score=84.79 GEMP01035876.1:146-1693(+)